MSNALELERAEGSVALCAGRVRGRKNAGYKLIPGVKGSVHSTIIHLSLYSVYALGR
jgi:hypothetical protein